MGLLDLIRVLLGSQSQPETWQNKPLPNFWRHSDHDFRPLFMNPQTGDVRNTPQPEMDDGTRQLLESLSIIPKQPADTAPPKRGIAPEEAYPKPVDLYSLLDMIRNTPKVNLRSGGMGSAM